MLRKTPFLSEKWKIALKITIILKMRYLWHLRFFKAKIKPCKCLSNDVLQLSFRKN